MSLIDLLEGKAKEDFRNWYFESKTKYHFSLYYLEACKNEEGVSDVYTLLIASPKSQQWGVIVDFAGSTKIDLIVMPNGLDKFYFKVFDRYTQDYLDVSNSINYDSRPKAREAAVREFSKLYNENK